MARYLVRRSRHRSRRVVRRSLVGAAIGAALGIAAGALAVKGRRPDATVAADRHDMRSASLISTAAEPADAPTLQELRNAVYAPFNTFGDPVILKDGRWEDAEGQRQVVSFVGTVRVAGDFDGDGRPDAAVALAESSGGSGERLYLALVNRAGTELRNVSTVLVGPNVKVRQARFADGAIELDVVQVGADDPMCCPSELATRRWIVENGSLKEEPRSSKTGKLTLATLSDHEWVLRSWTFSEEAPADPRVTVRFSDGRVTGDTGCNSYSAAATDGRQAGDVEIAAPISTRKACPDPAMKVESRFLRQLNAVRKYTFLGGQLALTYEIEGKVAGMLLDAAGN